MSRPTADPEPDVSPEQAQAELESVLRSPSFERSERLQRFLRFICEMTLQGEGHRINEYLIGSEVFQRGAGYSPNEDSIVRRQAHALRQKLQEHYATQTRERAVRIDLPIGRYVPVFRRVMAVPEPASAPPPPAAAVIAPPPEQTLQPEIQAPVPHRTRKPVLWAGITGLFLAGLLTGLLLPRASQTHIQLSGAATREIWSPWTQTGQDAVICFSNPMTAVIKYFDKPLPADALPHRFRAQLKEEQVFRQVFKLPPGGALYYTPVINQTKMGEAIAGVHLASLLTSGGVAVRSTQSRFLNWEDLRKENLILLGHNEANPWLEPVLKEYPFRLVATSEVRQRGIINTKPAPGEPPEYNITYSQAENDADEEYALLSMIPGVDGNRRLLLINGLNAQATQIATEFVTSESSLAQLLERLRQAAPTHSGPWHFQAILKTRVFDKVPTKATLVAVRVL